MDMKSLTQTLLSLIILVFVLAGIRKAVMFFSARWGLTGVASFLS